MTARREALTAAGVIAFLFAYWVASEVWYAHHIAPTGIATAADYLHRFPHPTAVCETTVDHKTYYIVSGDPLLLWCWATPSALPTYVFDADGNLVDWCPDRDETTSGFNDRWRISSHMSAVDTATFARRFPQNPR